MGLCYSKAEIKIDALGVFSKFFQKFSYKLIVALLWEATADMKLYQ